MFASILNKIPNTVSAMVKLLTIVSICVSPVVNAQHLSKEYINLCNVFFKDVRIRFDGSHGRLDCSAIIDSFSCTFSEMELWRKGGEKNTFYKYGPPCSTIQDSITFSSTEMHYIKEALETLAHEEWDSGNVLDSFNFIPQKFIDSIATIEKEKEPDGPDRGRFFYGHFSSRKLYQVSHPVFLRNNTVCIFYRAFEDPYGGGGSMDIYVKTKKEWVAFAELGSFIECR